MRVPTLPARELRALRLGAAVLAVGLFVGKAIPAARRIEATTREQARDRIAELARVRSSVGAMAETRDSAAARRERIVALAPRVLEGRTPAAAGASLAALVAGTAAQSQVELGSVEVRFDSVQAGRFVPVQVRADASGRLSGLLQMLSLLEAGPMLLRVPEWSLTQPFPGGAPDQPEMIRLEFVVEGLGAPEKGQP